MKQLVQLTLQLHCISLTITGCCIQKFWLQDQWTRRGQGQMVQDGVGTVTNGAGQGGDGDKWRRTGWGRGQMPALVSLSSPNLNYTS